MTLVFPCDSCGACCKLVRLSEQTSWLDRGDGICRHFNESNNLCNIYETRPEVCNVAVMYQKHYRDNYDWHSFVEINQIICHKLKHIVESPCASDQSLERINA